MLPYYSKIASKPSISKEEWEKLVAYLDNDVALALGTRMFYVLNQHSTHTYDYYVPGHLHLPPNHVVAKYTDQARKFVAILTSNTASEDPWYLAAQLLGLCNKRQIP